MESKKDWYDWIATASPRNDKGDEGPRIGGVECRVERPYSHLRGNDKGTNIYWIATASPRNDRGDEGVRIGGVGCWVERPYSHLRGNDKKYGNGKWFGVSRKNNPHRVWGIILSFVMIVYGNHNIEIW